MIRKENLIKLTGEDDLFYDTEERVYRYRMHCPHCGAVSGCQCFQDLEAAEEATVEGIDCCCSSKCALIYNKEEGGIEDVEAITEAMQGLNITKGISQLTYEEAMRVIKKLIEEEARENIDDPDWTFEKSSTVQAREHLNLRVPLSMLMSDQVIEILKVLNREEFGSIHELMTALGIIKKAEDVTEEEAQKILALCDFDCDAPMGESCNA